MHRTKDWSLIELLLKVCGCRYPRALATGLCLGTTFELHAVRPGVLEHAGVELFALLKHLVCDVADFPLRPVTAPLGEEVAERSQIHGHDEVGSDRVGEDKTCVLGGFIADVDDVPITIFCYLHYILECRQSLKVASNVRWHDVGQVIHLYIPLTLLAVAGNAMTHELVATSTGASDMPRQGRVFEG